MTAKTDEAGRKKKMKEFFDMLMLPFALAFVKSVFLKMAVAAFTGAASGKTFSFSFSLNLDFLLMLVLIHFWAKPAYKYVKNPDDKLKVAVRLRIGNVYRDAFLMLIIVQAVSMGISYALSGLASGAKLAAAGVAFLAQASLAVVYIDSILSKQKNLMEALYSPDELSLLRPGFSIPVYIKVSSMVFGFALIPFLLIYTAFLNRVPWDVFSGELVMMMFLSGVVLIKGLSSIYNGMQVPLDGLIIKMKRVAGGEFVKTRIYFSDEVAHLKAGFNEMVDGLKERKELQDTFGKYLSIEIARELIKNKKVNLGGEAMEAAVMFCDIRNFTPLSEKMSASDLIDFLNSYFHYITPPIALHNGVINKFMGDAVMAIYTPLLGSEDYAADAVRAAVAMRKALAEFNASGKAPSRVDFGIGVHAGRLVAGNIGTSARLEYTFIGDTVNIASRLESKTKDLNTDIIVSGIALEMARGSLGGSVAFESLGKVALKGKAETMELYKVV